MPSSSRRRRTTISPRSPCRGRDPSIRRALRPRAIRNPRCSRHGARPARPHRPRACRPLAGGGPLPDAAMADWLDDAIGGLSRDAVVVSWWSYSTPLWYGKLVEGRRPDLLIVDDSDIVSENLGGVDDVIDHYLGIRPVYVIRGHRRRPGGTGPTLCPGARRPAGRRLPRHGNHGDPAMTALAARLRHDRRSPNGSPACRTSSRPTTRRRTSRGWSQEALETLPANRRDVRDHRRRRRVEGPHPRDRRPLSPPSTGRGACHPP